MEQLTWTTEKRKVKELIPWDKNPRTMTRKQAEELKKSLEKFNLVEIPAINLDNKLVAGHQRVSILHVLGRGEEEIDVRVPSRMLTEEEFKEYNLRSNKNTGEWDFDALANNFSMDMLKKVGFNAQSLLLEKKSAGQTLEAFLLEHKKDVKLNIKVTDQKRVIAELTVKDGKTRSFMVHGNTLFSTE